MEIWFYSDDLAIRNSDATEIKAKFNTNGGVILYHDANEKIRTSSSGIDITGHTETDTLRVSGISTFTGNIDANGDLDVDGRTELDITNISETLNVVGIATFANNIDANGDLDVDGHTELDDLNVSGVSTFANNIDANGNLDVDGQTDLDVLNVSDTATFSANVDLGDDNRLRLGDGNDLQIFHNGSSSFIQQMGVGNFFITSNTDDGDIIISTDDGGELKLLPCRWLSLSSLWF